MAEKQYEWCTQTSLEDHFQKHCVNKPEFESTTWNRSNPTTEAEYLEIANIAIKGRTLTGMIEV